MEIVICIVVPVVALVVALITVFAVVCGYRMGRGVVHLFNRSSRKQESAEQGRESVIAANIERYDGTANGQQEVR